MRGKLKVKIIENYGSQLAVSQLLGIEQTRLSRIVRGHIDPRADEREKLVGEFGAAALKNQKNVILRRVQDDD
jgi:predicted XRE-type DNA-binding protein